MKVLVTGATGFTGNHLARHLHAAGHEVRTLARDPEKARTLGVGISVVRGDLLDRDSLKAACRDIDIVYNIAALYRQAGLPKETYRDVNARGVGWLIEAAGACGVKRVVHCSTVGVHGDIEQPPRDAAADHAFREAGDHHPRKDRDDVELHAVSFNSSKAYGRSTVMRRAATSIATQMCCANGIRTSPFAPATTSRLPPAPPSTRTTVPTGTPLTVSTAQPTS